MGCTRRGTRVSFTVHGSCFGGVLLAWLCVASPAHAGPTWVQTTDADFATGALAGLTVSDSGEAASLALAAAPFAWKRPLTVTNPTATDLGDFPVRLALNAGSFDFSHARTDGADLRVMDADDTTLLPFWIESWDAVAQTAVVWVKVPALAASDVRTFSLCYGSADAPAGGDAAATFTWFDDFEDLAGWTQSGNTISLSDGVVTLDSGSNPTIAVPVTAVPPYIVEAKYRHPSVFRNRLYLTRTGEGSPTGYDYGVFDSGGVFWGGYTGVTLAANTWYLMRWENILDNYTWRILNTAGGSLVARSHGSAIAGLNALRFSGTESANSDFSLDWVRIRPYAASEPTTALGVEESAGGRAIVAARGTFTSTAFDAGQYMGFTLAWDADQPTATALRFQVRAATTAAGLATASWRGPTGPDDWYTLSGVPIDTAGAPVRWLQYRAEFRSSATESSPCLRSVTVSAATGAAYTFTTDTAIPAGDTNYEGALLTVQGCTLTIDGQHALGALTLTGNALVSHPACTTGAVYSLDLTIAGALTIDTTSRIDVSGRGYLPGRTLGNTTTGGSTGHAGGSYGGLGNNREGATNWVYGDYADPNSLGSGGGTNWGNAGSGGGLVRITAAAVTVDGAILANGGGGWSSADPAGSGGGIRIAAGALAGGGSITANGGNGYANGGSGGGGRVAIYYDTSTFDPARVTADGGSGGDGAGAVGTVYLKQNGGTGVLRLDDHGKTTGMWTPLGQSSDPVFTADWLIITGSEVIAAVEHQMPIAANHVEVLDHAVLTTQATSASQEYALYLAVTDGLTVGADSRIDVSSCGYPAGRTASNTTTGGAQGHAGGSYGGLGNNAHGATNWVYGDYTNPNSLGSGGGTNWGSAGAGGGLVRITAAAVTVDGSILANGGSGWSSADPAGSGGGIRLDTATLTGSGTITANGGSGYANGGSGGGGRVAIYYDTSTFDSARVTADGGSGGDGSGAVGTVYLKQNGGEGVLRLDDHGKTTGMWTPLGQGSDTVFTADRLVFSGSGVIVAPEHQMPVQVNELQVLNAAVLTTQATTTTQEYSLLLTVAGGLTVDVSSAIDVSSCGYRRARTLGNTTTGAAQGHAGGSYGGLGNDQGGTPNWVYGDYTDPHELGSGGGSTWTDAGSGGGLARIQAATIALDGVLRANGGNGWSSADPAGSGGGIRLDVGALSGSGTITANGGNGYANGGSGGGGRVAVYYDSSTFDSARVTADGGGGGDGPGAVGTVYLKQNGGAGVLRLDDHGKATGVWTPLGQTGDTAFSADRLVLSGSGVVAAPEHQMPIQVNEMEVLNAAVLTARPTTAEQEYSLLLAVAGGLTVDAESAIDVSARGYLRGRTVGNTTTGAAQGHAGGSYGGLGNDTHSATNWVYGDYTDPNEPGSGGGTTWSGAGSGGGLVRIRAASAALDGALRANGGNGWSSADPAGSGGGIRLDVGALSGSGSITANGGEGYANGGSGSGGRVAVYYDSSTFDTAHVTADGGGGGDGAGAVGTVYLKQNGGEGVLRLDDHGKATGVWTPLGQSTDTVFTVDRLVISGSGVVAAPEHQIDVHAQNLAIAAGAVLTHRVTTTAQEFRLGVVVAGQFTIAADSGIDVSSRGYTWGHTDGNTTAGAAQQHAGGSYGGLGNASHGTANSIYGDPYCPNELGSGGGPAWGNAGSGGGLIQVTAGELVHDGFIRANGGGGWSSADPAGSGGGILLNVGSLAGSGTVTANGGNGYANGGSGGGGRVAVYTWSDLSLPVANVTANGGVGGDGAGETGTVVLETSPRFSWVGWQSALCHGQQPLRWVALGIDPAAIQVDFLVVNSGTSESVGEGLGAADGMTWDTTLVPDGTYELRVVFRDRATGTLLGEVTRTVLVGNAYGWHGGAVLADETWDAATLHVIEADLEVASGVRVTLEPGAVVKVASGVRVTVANGAVLDARGTEAAPIVFTSLLDDAVAGDTNCDGNATVPRPGDWAGIGLSGSGQLLTTAYTELYYLTTTHSGALATNEVWMGSLLHRVNGDVTVPAGLTLTINPGAVIKFEAGRSLTVQTGGTLLARGSTAQPIVFTSILDDTVGGDSNADGDRTTPAPGDWKRLHLDGGRADLDHCDLRYGAGPDNVQDALIRTSGASAQLTVANSRLADGFYTGVLCWGGTAVLSNTVIAGLDRGVSAHPSGTLQLSNCTLDYNRLGALVHGGLLTLTNSIISNSVQHGVDWDLGGTAPAVRYCDVWGSGTQNYHTIADQTGLNGNIAVDPAYKDRARGDFRLDYRSSCIDAADSAAAPATDPMGAPRYDDPRTANTGTPDADGAYADMGAYEFVESAASSVNLVVTAVAGPTEAVAGETVTVQWTVRNIGSGTVVGPWHDRVSILLADSPAAVAVSGGEVLVGEGVTLGPGESYTVSVTVRVPGNVVGSYVWQVDTNSRGDLFEGENSADNRGQSAARLALDLPELEVDGPALDGQFAEVGEEHWFRIAPSAHQDLLVSVTRSDDGATELYLATGYMPTTERHAVCQSQWNCATVSAPLTDTWPETYYVMVRAARLGGGPAAFRIEVDRIDFGLTACNPATAANAGRVTLTIQGGQLRSDMTYALAGTAGTITAESVFPVDTTWLYATFDLTACALGTYDLRATAAAGGVATLPHALEVVAGGTTNALQTRVLAPPWVRVGREYPIAVEYANTGLSDIVAPLLDLRAGSGLQLRLTQGSGAWSDRVQFFGVSPDGPAGILRPGTTQRVLVYAMGSRTGWLPCDLFATGAGDTTALDWSAFESQVRRPTSDPVKWAATWAQFMADTGSTWGDYVSALAGYATLASRRGQRYTSDTELFTFALVETYLDYYSNVSGTLYLDDTERPLGAALVTAYDADGDVGNIAMTEGDGTFRFFQMAPGTYELAVQGYLDGGLPALVVGTEPLTDLELIVTAGGTVRGSLVDASGAAVAGQEVELLGPDGPLTVQSSDSQGLFRFSGLVAGTYGVEVPDGNGFANASAADLVVTDTGAGPTVELVLRAAATVNGALTSVSAPEALAGAEVVVFNPLDFATTTLAADGSFSVTGLNPGTYSVYTLVPGHAETVWLDALVLSAGQTIAGWTGALEAEAVLTVNVTAPGGTPLSGAAVSLLLGGTALSTQTTGPDGTAAFTALASADYGVIAGASGYVEHSLGVSLAAGAHASCTVALQEAGSVTGTVTDALGTPLVALGVQIMDATGLVAGAVTDADGVYGVGGLAAGTYRVLLAGGFVSQPFVIDADHLAVTADLVAAGGSVRGGVVGPDGTTPMPNAKVILLSGSSSLAATMTDAGGAYGFDLVLPGTYSLIAVGADGVSAQTDPLVVDHTTTTVPALTAGAATLTGTVLSSTHGDPLADAQLTLAPIGPDGEPLGASLGTTSAADGSFAIAGLQPGSYVLWTKLAGKGPARQTVTVAAGGAVVAVGLSPACTLAGNVFSAGTGLAIPDATVVAVQASTGEVVGSASTGADGHYSLDNLAAGTYDLLVSATGYQNASSLGVALGAAGATRDLLLLVTDTSVAGTVLTASGAPAALMAVVARSAFGEVVASVQTDVDGNYTCDSLEPGTYAIRAEAAGWQSQEISGIVVAAGIPVTGMDLTVTPVVAVPVASGSKADAESQARALRLALTGLAKAGLGGPVSPTDPRVLDAIRNAWQGEMFHPTRDGWDNEEFPDIPAPRCTGAAQDAFRRACYYAKAKRDSFNLWNEAVLDFNHTRLRTAVTLSGDLASVFLNSLFLTVGGPVQLAELLAAQGAAWPVGAAINLTTALALVNGLGSAAVEIAQNLPNIDWNNPQAALASVTHLFNGFINAAGGADQLQALLRDLRTLRGSTSGELLSKIGLLTSVAVTIFDFLDLKGALDELGTACGDSMRNYHRDCALYHQARIDLMWANSRCNGTDILPNPPPDGGGTYSGGGGSNSGGAVDPNQKATLGVGDAGWVAPDSALLYTIHFENLASASFAAQQVVVTDDLAAALDWSTFALRQIGFNGVTIDVPDGLQEYSTQVAVATDPNPVRVTVIRDAESGRVTWTMVSIDPVSGQPHADPLVGFLPPNDDSGRGEGFVSFTIRPRPESASGTEITNQASIVFDVNPALVTNVVLNTIDAGTPAGAARALPAISPYPAVTVSWTGADEADGSGVATYDVYVSTDGGAFASWLNRCADASAVFAGERGHTYAFYALARDAVGHTEVQVEPLAETQTWVPLLTDDTDGDGLPDWFEALIINADPDDALADLADVGPGDDFDGDGAPNLHEYRAETDPASAADAPTALRPEGEFLAVVDAAGVAAGRGWWDLSGTYSTTLNGSPLILDLVHDTKGKVSGNATYTAAKDTAVVMPIKGSVQGSRGNVVLKGTMKGASAGRTVALALAFELTLDTTASPQLRGWLTGRIRADGVPANVDQELILDVPGGMDGTWTLRFVLDQAGSAVTGTARLTLSNGVARSFIVRGRTGADSTVVLGLAGDGSDPAAKAIKIKTTITPMEGAWARIEGFSGKGYGQTVAWPR